MRSQIHLREVAYERIRNTKPNKKNIRLRECIGSNGVVLMVPYDNKTY